MYAVIATGGKQYLVKPGSKIRVEKLSDSHKEGDAVTFDQVLMTADAAGSVTLGKPSLSGAKVAAKVTRVGRAAKVTVIKYKQKSRYFKKNGHRQPYFEVLIDSIK